MIGCPAAPPAPGGKAMTDVALPNFSSGKSGLPRQLSCSQRGAVPFFLVASFFPLWDISVSLPPARSLVLPGH